jgi:hypothetical protein
VLLQFLIAIFLKCSAIWRQIEMKRWPRPYDLVSPCLNSGAAS